MKDSLLQEIDNSIKENTVKVKRGEALQRLQANRDFKEIFLKGYFEDEAVRLVHLKSDHAMRHADSQTSIIKQIDAIGSVCAYLDEIYRQADISKAAIESEESERELVLQDEEGEY